MNPLWDKGSSLLLVVIGRKWLQRKPRITDGPSRIQPERYPVDETALIRAVSMERWSGSPHLGNENSVENLL